MEKRKLVRSGMFSHTVTLPREWVTRHKLDKGKTVYLEEQADGLLIKPGKAEKKPTNETEEKVIYVDNVSPNSILRDITSSFLSNIGTIRLVGKSLRQNIALFKKNILRFPGFEVIEETSDFLLVKDFINIEELVIPNLLRRADTIIRSLILDSFECLDTKDQKLAEAIRLRDQEVNRLVFLIYKCLNYISEHPQEGESRGVHPSYITHVWELNGYLEKIGDEIKRFAMGIPKAKLSKQETKEMESLLKETEILYTETMTSLYTNNIMRSDKAADQRNKTVEKCNAYLAKSHSLHGRPMVSRLVYTISFINSISRIIRYITFEKRKIVKGSIFVTQKSQL